MRCAEVRDSKLLMRREALEPALDVRVVGGRKLGAWTEGLLFKRLPEDRVWGCCFWSDWDLEVPYLAGCDSLKFSPIVNAAAMAFVFGC